VILELLEYLTTDCPADIRRLGYLKEAIAIKARHRRRCIAWGPHLARSRALVADAARDCARHRSVLILGSGLLLDIPLAALAQMFERVVLVDVVHLRQARRTAARHPNATLIAADVTGLVDGLHDRIRGGWRGTPVPQPSLFHDDPAIDLVVSANLLAQLPIMPAAALSRAGAGESAIREFRRATVEAHLAYLAGFRAKVCLITEATRETVDRDGGILRIDDALHGVRLPPEDAFWSWEIAPPGEIGRRIGIRNRIVGFADFRMARTAV
jgi:hypothetical protein